MLRYRGEPKILGDGKHVLEPGDVANVIPFQMIGESGFKATVIIEPKRKSRYSSNKTDLRYLFSCNIEYEKIEEFMKEWKEAGDGEDDDLS